MLLAKTCHASIRFQLKLQCLALLNGIRPEQTPWITVVHGFPLVRTTTLLIKQLTKLQTLLTLEEIQKSQSFTVKMDLPHVKPTLENLLNS
ncbi:hypothetical protein AMR42_12860 [Limnothrix sp. PR1529]|nr:hypothetical protein BCR12_11170 [Limnothrix sp. P13C2]PIB09248.1 hypothetical protein AMR42_12860 [Limnothrix sp. PR1529]